MYCASYVVYNPENAWFSLHPVAFILGFAFVCNAVWVQKRYHAHSVHMLLQWVGCALVLFGAYVIWTVKESYGKNHWYDFTCLLQLLGFAEAPADSEVVCKISYHGFFGGCFSVCMGLQTLLASFTIHPYTTFQQRKQYVSGHKFGGRFFFLLFVGVLASGWWKFYADNPLYHLSFFALLSFVSLAIVFLPRRMSLWL